MSENQKKTNSNSKFRNVILTFLKISVTFGIVFLLLKSVVGDKKQEIFEQFQSINLNYYFIAIILYGLIIFFTMIRWFILLKMQNINLSFKDVAKLQMVGIMFNTAIPGAVGGDLIKMACITQKAPQKKTEGILTIAIDRIIGLLGLFILTSILIPFLLPFFQKNNSYEIILSLKIIGAGGALGLIGSIGVFYRDKLSNFKITRFFIDKLRPKLPKRLNNIIDKIVAAIDLIRGNSKSIVLLLIFSTCIHTINGLTFYCVARAIGETQVPILHYILTIQIANAISVVVPLPGGLGIRDQIGKIYLTAAGASQILAAAAALTFTTIIILWSLLCIPVFLFNRDLMKKNE